MLCLCEARSQKESYNAGFQGSPLNSVLVKLFDRQRSDSFSAIVVRAGFDVSSLGASAFPDESMWRRATALVFCAG